MISVPVFGRNHSSTKNLADVILTAAVPQALRNTTQPEAAYSAHVI
jgi:hypothetical protein